MALIVIEGVFMGANIKTSTFDGNTTTSLYIDIYQPQSETGNKMVQLKSDNVALYQTITSEYAMGSVFKCNATVNAYQNRAYFKLLDILEAS